ncbi:MAG TPA: c-type cytochrome [Chromobacteriaceae bacterium]|nr:c-type cytochrome [Chromobacteriaceae bacterium]
MKTFGIALTLSALVILSGEALAATPQGLLQQHNCLACHAVDHKVVGPAYKEVAAKYKGQKVLAKVMDKVKKGGSGSFGAIPMPANPQVPDADLKTMVQWILTQ